MLLPLKVMACGLDWREPISHFPNVDFQGNVHIVRKLGEVEKLPIYLIFNSAFGNSPYAGYGFEVPLFQSRIWQVDENRFQMKSPSGWLWTFQRTKVPNVLEGNAGWKGLIKDNYITVWGECGDKLSFKNGTLVSMQIKEDKFDYIYKDNRVERLLKNGRTIIEVMSDAVTGDVSGLNLTNSRQEIGFQQSGSRPRTEIAGGVSVVSRVDKTLSDVTKPDGSKNTFVFGLDQKMNPTLKYEGKEFCWDQTTKKIARDGEWNYTIYPATETFLNAGIRRTNASNQSEFWNNDREKGVETTSNRNGVTTVQTKFTSGVLSGKIRRIEEIHPNGCNEILYAASYDELGRIKRETRGSEMAIYAYDGEMLQSITTDKKTIAFDLQQNKNILISVYKHGKRIQCMIDENGVPITLSRK